MNTRLRHTLGLLAVLGFCQAQPSSLRAQNQIQPPAFPAAASVANAKFPPMPPSPVQSFRDLMELSPTQCEKLLANRSPEIRQRILAKLEEYKAMPAEDRETRLRTTELRWYLLSFMDKSPSERAAQMSIVPVDERQLINDRLQQWDRLPTEEKSEVLKYEKTMEQLAGQRLDGAAATNHVLMVVAPAAQPDALKNLDHFLELPPSQREQIYSSFQRFFALNDQDKQKTLDVLSDVERAQVKLALNHFSSLPDDQRALCLKAFGKFSQMNDAERSEFLKNAERWRELPVAQRQAWRNLVNHMMPMPPLPPGLGYPPMPPLPALPQQVNTEPVTHTSP